MGRCLCVFLMWLGCHGFCAVTCTALHNVYVRLTLGEYPVRCRPVDKGKEAECTVHPPHLPTLQASEFMTLGRSSRKRIRLRTLVRISASIESPAHQVTLKSRSTCPCRSQFKRIPIHGGQIWALTPATRSSQAHDWLQPSKFRDPGLP